MMHFINQELGLRMDVLTVAAAVRQECGEERVQRFCFEWPTWYTAFADILFRPSSVSNSPSHEGFMAS
jgi:hypothetical protein